MGIIGTIAIGLLAGVIAKLVVSGPNDPSGFVLTTVPVIVAAFAAQPIGNGLGMTILMDETGQVPSKEDRKKQTL